MEPTPHPDSTPAVEPAADLLRTVATLLDAGLPAPDSVMLGEGVVYLRLRTRDHFEPWTRLLQLPAPHWHEVVIESPRDVTVVANACWPTDAVLGKPIRPYGQVITSMPIEQWKAAQS